jgi:hypothetical protein
MNPAHLAPKAPPRPIGKDTRHTKPEVITKSFRSYAAAAFKECVPATGRPKSEGFSYVIAHTNEASDENRFNMTSSVSASTHTTPIFALAVHMLKKYGGKINVDYGRVWAQCVLGGGGGGHTASYCDKATMFNRCTERFAAMFANAAELDTFIRKLNYNGSWMLAVEQVTRERGVQRIVVGSGLSEEFPAIGLIKNVLPAIDGDTGALNMERVNRNLAQQERSRQEESSSEREAFRDTFIWEKERENRELEEANDASLMEGVEEFEAATAGGL